MTDLVDIVGSRSKAEILRLLFGSQPRELHLREMVRQSGLALGTLQQELRRLTRTEVIFARRDGNRLYYQANTRNPLYAELHGLVLKTNGLAGLFQAAFTSPDISVAFVFGSIARREARAESDVDLMVIGTIGLRRLTPLLAGIAGQLGREINPHCLTPAEFRAKKLKREHFLASVLEAPKIFVKGTANELEAMG